MGQCSRVGRPVRRTPPSLAKAITAIAVAASSAASITSPLLPSSRWVSTSAPVPLDSFDVDAEVVGGWDVGCCDVDDPPPSGGGTTTLFGGGGAALVVRGWLVDGVDCCDDVGGAGVVLLLLELGGVEVGDVDGPVVAEPICRIPGMFSESGTFSDSPPS